MILGRNLYIYSLIFLVVVVVLTIILGTRIYKNFEKMMDLLFEKTKTIPDLIRRIERKEGSR
ncbi:MAG: hypothetical protein HY755_04450 [Nitrospirae bacterium]|nr:hypothetical protein [Nitrospirota bacterium]